MRLLPFLPSLTWESSCAIFSLFVSKFSHWLEWNLFSATCLGGVDILESFQLLKPMRTGIGLYKDLVTFKSFSHLGHLYCLQCILLIMCWCFSQLWFVFESSQESMLSKVSTIPFHYVYVCWCCFSVFWLILVIEVSTSYKWFSITILHVGSSLLCSEFELLICNSCIVAC